MPNWNLDIVCPECKGKKSPVFTICKWCMKYDICFCGVQKLKRFSTCKKCYESEKKLHDYIRKKPMIWPKDNKSNTQNDDFFKDTIPKCFLCSSYGRPIKHLSKDCPKQQYKDFSYSLW
ncbi:3437_t:CDS:1 [Scutellospora calospora]|uniref:3437_t:CDS:1 n=1 Tax=Scutellospora calospora TaxID=85575 RepID=A0ACA9MDV8_9GLOM|nr:3437_t:CDS:1 [Scutellospora calospora]